MRSKYGCICGSRFSNSVQEIMMSLFYSEFLTVLYAWNWMDWIVTLLFIYFVGCN